MLSVNYARLFGNSEWQYKRAGKIENGDHVWGIDMPLVVIGPSGRGKTLAVREYIESRKKGFYFSFKNASYALAVRLFSQQYPEVFGACKSWDEFFRRFDEELGFRYYASIVFEDIDFDRMDPDFINSLRSFLRRHKSRNVFVILTGRKAPAADDGYMFSSIGRLTIGQVNKTFPEYGDLDTIRLLALTDGDAGLLNEIDPGESIYENVHRLFAEGSRFLRHAEIRCRESFRSPDSYSALLYAMATGVHKLTELAEYSGYSANKCDKYLRSLIDADLVVTGDVQSHDGRSRRGYFLESSFITLWTLFCMIRPHGKSDREVCDEILEYIDKEMLPGFFRRLCGIWIKKHGYKLHPADLRLNDVLNYNFDAGDITFDYVQRDGDRMLFVKVWDDLKSTKGTKEWQEIQEAILPLNTFYNNEIVLCSLRRFREEMWEHPRNYQNLHLMEARYMLTGDEMWEISKQDSDTFYKIWAQLK